MRVKHNSQHKRPARNIIIPSPMGAIFVVSCCFPVYNCANEFKIVSTEPSDLDSKKLTT